MKIASSLLFYFNIAIALLFLSACERSPTTKAVVWPELVAFDEIAYQAEGLAKLKDEAGILEQRPSILEAGRAVSVATMPANVVNKSAVEQLLKDLSSLVEGFADNDIESGHLISLAEGLHPIVAELIEKAGMPHIHASEGPNNGNLHPIFGIDGNQVGTAEIKLHDDAGDIEVWLTQGGHGGAAWDLPVDHVLKIQFTALDKQIDLAVRDKTENRDESDMVTVRDGKTNYFVFPGETGADAAWLMGEDFVAKAILNLEAAGATTGEILLRPHVHHGDEEEH